MFPIQKKLPSLVNWVAWAGFLAITMAMPWLLGGNAPFAATVALAVGVVLLPLALSTSPQGGAFPALVLAGVLLWLYAWAPFARVAVPSLSGWVPEISLPQTAERLPGLLLPVVFLVLGFLVLDRPGRVEWFLGALVGNGALLAILGIAQRLAWNGRVFWIYQLVEGGKPFAAWVNRNNGGGWMLMALAAGLFFVARRSIRNAASDDLQVTGPVGERNGFLKRRLRALTMQFALVDTRHLYALAGLTAVLVGVIASLSRGAYVSLVAFLLVAIGVLLFSRRAAAFGVVLTLLIALGLVVWTEQLESFTQRAGTLVEIEDASAPRLTHWRDTWPLVRQHWLLGSGLGTWKLLYPPYESGVFTKWFEHAENQYLEITCELGLPGILLVGLGIGLAVGLAVRLLGRPESTGRVLGVMLLSAVAAQVVMASVDFGLFLPANSVTLAALLASGFGYENYTRRMSRLGQKSAGNGMAVPLRWGIVLLLLAAGFWSVRQNYAVDLRDMATRDLARLHRDTDPAALERSRELLEASLAVRPGDGFAHFELGRYWSARYRLEELRRLRTEPVDPVFLKTPENGFPVVASGTMPEIDEDAIWTATSPGWLRDSLIEDLAGVPENDRAKYAQAQMPEELQNALEEFRLADKNCPYVSRFRLERTRLELLMTGDQELERRLVDETIALCPNDAEALFQCGLLLIDSPWRADGAELWGRVLELSRQYDREIVEGSKRVLTLREFLETVLPDDPDFLVFVSRKHFSSPSDQLLKQLLLNHTVEVIGRSGATPAAKEAWLAEGDFMAGRLQLASSRYAALLKNEPGRVEWRTMYAQALAGMGSLDSAIEQLMICQQHTQSDKRLVERLQRQFRRLRDSGH